MRRIGTAIVLTAAVLALIKLLPPWAFQVFAGLLTLAGMWEFYRMLEVRGGRPFKLVGLAAGAALLWSFVDREPSFEAAVAVLVAAAVATIASLWWRGDPAAMLEASGGTVFPLVLVVLPLAHVLAIRSLPGERGEDLLLLLLTCIAFSDTAAYYVGSAIGRRPLAPRLSPRKSWEGVAGGLAGSVIAALLAHLWFYQALPLVHAVILGLLLGALGVLGDLAESMIKRAAGVKDSSTLLPGHGGVLDRADSFLFSAPLLFYYYHSFLERIP